MAEVPAIRSWACDGFMGDWDGLMGIFFGALEPVNNECLWDMNSRNPKKMMVTKK